MTSPFIPLLLHLVIAEKPAPFELVTLFFASGAIRTGFWDGNEWIYDGGSEEPEQWQALPHSDIAA